MTTKIDVNERVYVWHDTILGVTKQQPPWVAKIPDVISKEQLCYYRLKHQDFDLWIMSLDSNGNFL